jgi:hypothetical protein
LTVNTWSAARQDALEHPQHPYKRPFALSEPGLECLGRDPLFDDDRVPKSFATNAGMK